MSPRTGLPLATAVTPFALFPLSSLSRSPSPSTAATVFDHPLHQYVVEYFAKVTGPSLGRTMVYQPRKSCGQHAIAHEGGHETMSNFSLPPSNESFVRSVVIPICFESLLGFPAFQLLKCSSSLPDCEPTPLLPAESRPRFLLNVIRKKDRRNNVELDVMYDI